MKKHVLTTDDADLIAEALRAHIVEIRVTGTHADRLRLAKLADMIAGAHDGGIHVYTDEEPKQ